VKKPRILLLTPMPPFPPDNGGMLRILSLAGRLRERCELSLMTFVRTTGERRFQQNAALMALKSVFTEVYPVPKESTGSSSPPAGLPEIAREWFSDDMAGLLGRLTREDRFDAVHVEFLQMAAYARFVEGASTVLTEHDLSHLSFFHSYFREWTGLKRWLRIGDWLRTRRFHSEACARFHRVVVLTPEDRGRLERVLPPERISLIPTCVDLDRFSFRPEGNAAREFDTAYVGHYPHFPNEDAALWFCTELLPLIRRKRPGSKTLLIGSSPTERIRALAGADVEVTGTVPEVGPQLDRARVFVAPVRLGFGIKGKVLEAFSRGLPVVATSVVQRGIPESRPGEDLLVADSPRDFAAAVCRVLEDSGLRERLTANGRALVERHYSWDRSCDSLMRLYEGLRDPRAGNRAEAAVG